jgi:hypothetical protein
MRTQCHAGCKCRVCKARPLSRDCSVADGSKASGKRGERQLRRVGIPASAQVMSLI